MSFSAASQSYRSGFQSRTGLAVARHRLSNSHTSPPHVKMEPMPAPLRALFFDVGNTLLFPDRTHILAPLHQRKLTPSLAQWHAIERKTKKEFDDILQHDGKADHGFWYLFYSHLLPELGVHNDALRD